MSLNDALKKPFKLDSVNLAASAASDYCLAVVGGHLQSHELTISVIHEDDDFFESIPAIPATNVKQIQLVTYRNYEVIPVPMGKQNERPCRHRHVHRIRVDWGWGQLVQFSFKAGVIDVKHAGEWLVLRAETP